MEKSALRKAADRYIGDMQRLIDAALSDVIPDEPFALLDFPDIRNVGDSAIWLGEIAYLRRRFGRSPAYAATDRAFDAGSLEKHVPAGPILLHGGGNFGDIWPSHQRFRERIIERYPDRLIVQFPQSIHYADPAGIAEAARVINAHPRFVLLVRDRESKALADRHFSCRTILCPDMAFCIGALQPSGTADVPVLAMLREDKEKVASDGPAGLGVPVEDWITEDRRLVRLAKLRGLAAELPTLHRGRIRERMYTAAARQRFYDRGVRQLSRGRAIVTDRLHVHIVSILLGKPHAVLDNSYSKIGRFRDAFPEPEALTHKAASLDEAIDWARVAAAGA